MITSRLEPASDPARAGDGEDLDGFQAFVVRHQRMVWRYLRLLGADYDEAEDLLQETFLRAVDTSELTSPAAFLRTVARHLLLSARRSARRRPPTVEWSDAVDQLVASDPSTLSDIRLDELRECVQRLSDKARRAIDLHYLQGQDYRAVGRALGIRRNGLKTLLARARKELRRCLTHNTSTSPRP